MKRMMIAAWAICAATAATLAAAPGPLDGQNIPTDFANAKLIGLQTNRTGVGDASDLGVVATYSEGTELDALYLAIDSTYLYVGLAGNLLDVGNPFIIFIDNEFDFGQTELRTEGVDGPPWALQLAGREVVVNTNGTPADGADDTYTVTPNSGTILPECGLGFTGWDYALAVDGAGGVMYAHQYILYGTQIGVASAGDLCHFGDDRGRVACDPTPDNPGDSPLPIYAIRAHVAESPIDDGNEIFEGGEAAAGYQRGGFINANTTGVTDASAALASMTTSGVEIAIPLANIGDSGLFGDEIIHLLILTMDADEYDESGITEGFGTVLNQALPSLSGSACTTPQNPGLRPDLSSIASCLTVDLTTLDTIATSALLEGDIEPTDYDSDAPVLTQSCPTAAGDQARVADILQPIQDGSELNALYADNDDDFLYLGLTGNLQADGTSINVFVDADPEGVNGEHVIDFDGGSSVYTYTQITDFSNFHFSGRYEQWVFGTMTSGPNDFRIVTTDFGGGFYDINPNVDATGAIALNLDVTLNPANLADIIRVILVDEDLTERVYRFDIPTNGVYSLSMPLNRYTNDQSPGSVPGLDVSNLTFFHITGGFNHDNPGVTFDATFDNMSLTGVIPGAAAIVTLAGDELANSPLDILNNNRFPANAPVNYDVAYGINLSYMPHLAYVDYFDLVNDTFTFRGAVEPESGSSTLFDNPGGLVAENPNGLEMAFNNWNTNGVIGCADGDPCFNEDSATVAARAEGATSGVEMAIPLADLGLTSADLPRVIHVWTMVSGADGYASDQSLPSMRNYSGDGNQVVNPGIAPVNFTDPSSGASSGATLTDFSNFALTGTYGQWDTATFTSGATDFRVQSTDFGGGFFDIDPNVDASGATQLVVDVTLNPANLTDKLVVVLVDDDGTERVYRFENLTNGAQTLTVPLSMYINDNAPGSVPGLDISNLSFFHLGGAFHHGNPGFVMDVTFDNLALVGEPRNFEARAARVCLATVTGDADCDGDNDLEDFALLQQCIGVSADPVLPMECEQLDFVKDRVINESDVATFVSLIDGP